MARIVKARVWALRVTPAGREPEEMEADLQNGEQHAFDAAKRHRVMYHREGERLEVLCDGERVAGWRYDGQQWRPWPAPSGSREPGPTVVHPLRLTPEERAEVKAALTPDQQRAALLEAARRAKG